MLQVIHNSALKDGPNSCRLSLAPNELSINNVEAIPKIHSLKWQKSISYSQGLLGSAPEPHLASLQALRSRQSRSSIDLNLTGQANDFFGLLQMLSTRSAARFGTPPLARELSSVTTPSS